MTWLKPSQMTSEKVAAVSFPKLEDFNLIKKGADKDSASVSQFLRSAGMWKARRILSDPELEERGTKKSMEEYFGG